MMWPASISTVPLKGKLAVSTRNSILEGFENRALSFDFRIDHGMIPSSWASWRIEAISADSAISVLLA